ncbi:MAG: hypothetical protein MJZ46_00320 [Bacteroidales bacterium]|nr:hypothetical protein [Bacteroidales bacterium]
MNIGRKRSDIINKMFSSYILSSILIMVSVPILEITDGIMLNRAVSPDALSMVALLAPVNIFFFAIKTIFVTGLSILSAKALGECDYHKGSQLFTVAITSNAIVIIGLTALAYLFFPQFVQLFCDIDSPIHPLLYEYVKVILLQFPLLAILSSLDTYMRLAGKSRLVSVTIIVSCFLNIVLTWIFLYVLHLGIRGAAIATIICAIITKIPYIPYLISGKFPFRIVKTKLSTYFEMIWLGVKRGSPSALNDIVMSVIFFATNGIVLNTQGVQGMFIWSVTLQLLSLTGMISMGFNGVMQHIGVMLLGENDNEGFMILSKKMFWIQLSSIVVVVALCLISPRDILYFFTNGTVTVTDQFIHYFILGILMLLPMKTCISITEIINIGGHTGLALIVNLLSLVSIFIAAFASVALGTKYFWWMLPTLQMIVLVFLMATTIIMHIKNRYYSWFALVPTMPDGVSMLLTAKYDPKEIDPMLKTVSKFLAIAELPENVERDVRLICEELVYHVIAEKNANPDITFELRLSDKPDKLIVFVKEIGNLKNLNDFLNAETLSTKMISTTVPEAKYDYFNGVCVISICIGKTQV